MWSLPVLAFILVIVLVCRKADGSFDGNKIVGVAIFLLILSILSPAISAFFGA